MRACWIGGAIVIAMMGCDASDEEDECAGMVYVPRVRDVELAELPMRRLVVGHPDGSTVEVVLKFGPVLDLNIAPTASPSLHDRDGAYCPRYRFRARLGDEETSYAGGGWFCAGPSGGVCESPVVSVPVPDDGSPLPALEMFDDSISIPVELNR